MHLSPTSKLGYLSFNVALTSEVISPRCLLVAVVLYVLPHRTAITVYRHSVQTQGQPVVEISLDVDRHTGIKNQTFYWD